MSNMTTSTLQARPNTSIASGHAFEVRLCTPVQVADPAKLAKALNAILALDLGTDAERLIRSEIRESLR